VYPEPKFFLALQHIQPPSGVDQSAGLQMILIASNSLLS
jgi:hypothetical protein